MNNKFKTMFFSHFNQNKINKKLKIIFYFINIFPLLIIPLNSEEINKKSNLTIDYLKKTPQIEYLLGEGDFLNIIISRELPNLTSEEIIDVKGTISLPIIKEIYVSGLTTKELSELLNKKYKEHIHYPNVEISIIRYRPIVVYIKGEVDQPGIYRLDGAYYPYSNFNKDKVNSVNSQKIDNSNFLKSDISLSDNSGFDNSGFNNSGFDDFGFGVGKTSYFPTLFDAIRKAGGITNHSNLSEIQVKRINSLSKGGGYVKAEVDFLDLITNGNESQNIRLLDGDIITIAKSNDQLNNQISSAIKSNLQPKNIQIVLAGRIKNPGTFSIPKTASLNEALIASGGLKAIRGKVIFLRYNNDGSIDRRKFSYSKNSKRGSYKNPYLNNGDIISIDETKLTIASQIIVDITKPALGIYSTFKILD